MATSKKTTHGVKRAPARKKAGTGSKRKTKKRGRRASGSPSRTRRIIKYLILGVAAGLILFLVATIGGVLVYRFAAPAVTPLMKMRQGEGLGLDYQWRAREYISPHLAVAVLAAEDQRFPEHRGFDLNEVKRAVGKHLLGERLRGASTISQQVAKNVFLWPARSWWRKGLEVYFTVLIEMLWPKARILEVYLNVVELGPGLYGAEAAARHYYGVSSADLTREQAASLASILPNPLRYSPTRPDDKVRARRTWILKQMENLGGTRFLERIAPQSS